MKRDSDESNAALGGGTVGSAEGPKLLLGALLGQSVGSYDGVRVGELLGEQLGPTLGPLVGSVGALFGESVGAEGPILDGVAVGAAEEVYVGLYMIALRTNIRVQYVPYVGIVTDLFLDLGRMHKQLCFQMYCHYVDKITADDILCSEDDNKIPTEYMDDIVQYKCQ